MVGDLRKLGKAAAAAGKELDRGDPRGCTAFHHACAGGHVDCVKALLKAGCGTARTNDAGETGWALARQSGRQPALMLLRKYAAKGHPELGLELALEQAAAAEEAAAASSIRDASLD
jgi:ankyrin repeat protein